MQLIHGEGKKIVFFLPCIVSKPWLINTEGIQDELCPGHDYFLGSHTGPDPEVQVRGDSIQDFSYVVIYCWKWKCAIHVHYTIVTKWSEWGLSDSKKEL